MTASDKWERDEFAEDLARRLTVSEAALAAARARIEQLEGALHRDQTGLAQAMNEVRGLARSYDWLADPDAWGAYDYTERTVATLRKEIGWCFDAMRKVIENALAASGRIAQLNLTTETWTLAGGRKVEVPKTDLLETKHEPRCPECNWPVHEHLPSGMYGCDRCGMLIPKHLAK